jgi:hypothetical protein
MRSPDLSKWSAMIVLSLVVLATAIYAMTTWNENALNSSPRGAHPSSQLPDQNNMVPGLQAQPGGPAGLGGGSSSTQLQPGTSTNQGTQPAVPPSSDNTNYPTDPTPCGGYSGTMCTAQ